MIFPRLPLREGIASFDAVASEAAKSITELMFPEVFGPTDERFFVDIRDQLARSYDIPIVLTCGREGDG